MRHSFMESIAERLADRGIATFRYQFPYMEQGSPRPDPPPVLMATVRSAVAAAAAAAGDLPLLAGGKSLGGRMASMAAAEKPLPGVRGLVFFGFPLHAAGKPGVDRGEHLASVPVPMLFLQGTRDRLAELPLLRPLLSRLGDRAQLYVVNDADHSFHLPKRSGKTDQAVLEELAQAAGEWASRQR
jgi:predicted alpha/beta-hydrolase family hydrolase